MSAAEMILSEAKENHITRNVFNVLGWWRAKGKFHTTANFTQLLKSGVIKM